MKLLPKVVSIAIVIMLISEVIILYVTWTSNYRTLDLRIRESMQEMASSNMNKIDRTLFERTGDIKVIASDPVITSRDSSPQQIVERLIEYRDIYKTYVSLSFFDLNRVRIADTAGLNLGKQDEHKYWDDILQGKSSISSDVGLDKSLGIPVIYFASPVKDKNNQPLGTVVTRMPVDMLHEILGKPGIMQQTPEQMHIDLVDGDGLLIYSNYNRKGMLIEEPPYWEEVKNRSEEKTGTIEIYGHTDLEDSLLVFCREQGYLDFMGNGWTLALHIPTHIVFAPLTELRNKWILVLLPSTILAVIISLFFSFRLSKPLAELRESLAGVGKGKLDTRVKIRSRDEIGDLGDYFNKMAENLERTTTSISNLEREITERKQTEQELRETKERLHYLVGSSPAVIYTSEPSGDYGATFVSENVKMQFGYEPQQFTKDPGFWASHIHPEDTQRVFNDLPHLFEVDVHSYEYRFLHNDGTYRWIYDEMKLLRDPEGRPLEIIGYWADVTERKQAETAMNESLVEKETLLKEVHHRVKNNMQVISSLLRMQAGKVKDKDVLAMLKDSQNRIQSMALVYNKLYQSQNLASINMADYIKELTTGLIKSYTTSPSRVTASIDPSDVSLGIDMAIPCVLVINELVINSLKYAFPENRTGQIAISLKEDGNQELELVVSDNGVGIPEGINLANTSTLGLKLVTNLVENQLDGKIELDRTQGTTFKITIRREEEKK